MSQKWIRSKRWDDENFPAWAFPAKWLLRAFSSIWLAVILLILVAIYGTLASVPIGLLAKIPTVLIYALTVVAALVVGAAAPTLLTTRLLRTMGVGRGGRFAVGLLMLLGLGAGAVAAWHQLAWPRLAYSARTGEGVMLFASFVERYNSTTLRRLPGLEMSELEFYSWWPLRVILLAFIANMITATLRRIEFTFHNIGVLTVHTGIVTIALGSIYYAAGKQEGDMLLMAGELDERGSMSPGREKGGFYDNTDVVLFLSQGAGERGLEQRPIRHLPRYNDYGLNVLSVDELAAEGAAFDRGRTLDIPVRSVGLRPGAAPVVDPDLEFSIVGYASYAELDVRWVASRGVPVGEMPNPMRRIELLSSLPSVQGADGATPLAAGEGAGAGEGEGEGEASIVAGARFLPERPAERVRWLEDAVAMEYTRGMPDWRWRDLSTRLPGHVQHALAIEVPGETGGAGGFRQVFGASKGMRIEVGATGYTVEVEDILPKAPFPIITRGYEGSESSVAVLRITPPAGAGGEPGAAFTRYVYHRFPEISQDLLEQMSERGMPLRRDADPAIRIGFIDASMVQVYIDEDPADASAIRSIVRLPGRDPVVTDRVPPGGSIAVAPMVSLRLAERWPHAGSLQVPRIVPAHERDNQNIGTHRQAAVAVRVSLADDPSGWSRTLWVPFSLYLGVDPGLSRTVQTPDGREVSISFGRRRHSFPGLVLKLVEFEMIPYPHSDVPQDYRSDLLVLTSWRGQFNQQVRTTSLNAPLLLRVPFHPREHAPGYVNFIGWALSPIVPTQYKFSQAGWDPEGWRQSKTLVDQGLIERPVARFTILGVGNNPGIYIVAAGSIMMSCGIPWAFYVKPWLVRRKKRRIQAELAARTATAKSDAPAQGPVARAGSDKRVEIPAGAER